MTYEKELREKIKQRREAFGQKEWTQVYLSALSSGSPTETNAAHERAVSIADHFALFMAERWMHGYLR